MGDLRGRLFLVKDFPGADFPGAVDSSSSEDRVRGEVYELHDEPALLEKLDEYEECSPNDPKPTLYRREKRNVVLEDGRTVEAWVYLFNRPTDGLPRIRSGDFLAVSG